MKLAYRSAVKHYSHLCKSYCLLFIYGKKQGEGVAPSGHIQSFIIYQTWRSITKTHSRITQSIKSSATSRNGSEMGCTVTQILNVVVIADRMSDVCSSSKVFHTQNVPHLILMTLASTVYDSGWLPSWIWLENSHYVRYVLFFYVI